MDPSGGFGARSGISKWKLLYSEHQETNGKDGGTTGDNTTKDGCPKRLKTEKRERQKDRILKESQEEEEEKKVKRSENTTAVIGRFSTTGTR